MNRIGYVAQQTFYSWMSTKELLLAPVRILNLRDVDVVGWLYDVAFRAGAPVTLFFEQAFVVGRFLGGGADGTAGEGRYWTQTVGLQGLLFIRGPRQHPSA